MNKDLKEKFAFTLAEVLITLGIIGIVSAMTIPTLVKNYQKKVTVTKLQKVHAVLNQIARMAVVDGSVKGYTSGQGVTGEKTKEFFDTFIFPYLKSPKIISSGNTVYKNCDNANYCHKYLNGGSSGIAIQTSYPSGRVFFATSDNALYFCTILAWDNKYDEEGNLVQHIARYSDTMDVFVDIDGASGKNTIGKDIFNFTLNFSKGSAYPRNINSTDAGIKNSCSLSGTGYACSAKIMKDGWKITDDYPW